MTTSTLPENFEFILDTNETLPSSPPEGVTTSVLWPVIIYLVRLLKQGKTEGVELRAELRLQKDKRFGSSSEKQDTIVDPFVKTTKKEK